MRIVLFYLSHLGLTHFIAKEVYTVFCASLFDYSIITGISSWWDKKDQL